jgi:polyphosphate glucokinase
MEESRTEIMASKARDNGPSESAAGNVSPDTSVADDKKGPNSRSAARPTQGATPVKRTAAKKKAAPNRAKAAAVVASKPATPASVAKSLRPSKAPPAEVRGVLTLAIDIGGTGIKAEKLDRNGRPVTDRMKIATPKHADPAAVVRIVRKLARALAPFDRVSVGFPGVVKDGLVYSAPNLGKGWNKVDLRSVLERKLGKPVRVANDADVQGLGAVSGKGVELVITLGTGFGSVIFVDGHRIHMELGHAPFHRGKTYEQELGVKALKRKGKAKWNRLLAEAIDDLARTFNYDRLYIGGGNARHINFKLPAGVSIVSNEEGLLGGIRLWEQNSTRGAIATARKSGNQVQAR